jgi:NAD-dependent deacetylase
MNHLNEAREALVHSSGIVVVTGAGVSAESGIPTFRAGGTGAGLWERYRPEDLATPEAFARDPLLVWSWYDYRRHLVLTASPNPGHLAIARLLLERDDAILVTQNVDGLHQRALESVVRASGDGGPGSRACPDEKASGERASDEGASDEVASGDRLRAAMNRILPLHGSLLEVRCSSCSYRIPDRNRIDASSIEALPHCPGCSALLRPAVVWFGEMLDAEVLDRAFAAAAESESCLAAGTSAVVHPAAAVPVHTVRSGGWLIEVNPQPTPLSPMARWSFQALAGEVLPALLGDGSRGLRRENGDS